MVAHPVPIYLGCAGLLIGTLGMGAQSALHVDRPASNNEPPLFARSVEEAALPVERWPSKGNIPYYAPMLDLAQTTARSSDASPNEHRSDPNPNEHEDAPRTVREIPLHATGEPPPAPRLSSPPPASRSTPPAVVPPREIVRDLPNKRARGTRAKNAKSRHAPADRAATTESDPREAYAKSTGDDDSRRAERRHRQRTDPERSRQRTEPEKRRSSAGRRNRDDERVPARERDDERVHARERVVIRERAPEVRGREQEDRPRAERSGRFQFNPFRLFGSFNPN